ncbi:MAG: hypothetical protein ACLFV6_13860 [Spirulinaceae cyanobacterium]
MLENLNLDDLNPNPFLIQALNLDNPQELIKLNVYMAATRSIVTSMGFFIEKLLVAMTQTTAKNCSKCCEKPPNKFSIGTQFVMPLMLVLPG